MHVLVCEAGKRATHANTKVDSLCDLDLMIWLIRRSSKQCIELSDLRRLHIPPAVVDRDRWEAMCCIATAEVGNSCMYSIQSRVGFPVSFTLH